MIIRKTDINGDWQFGKGKSDFATRDQAIRQNIQSRLLSWKNDCFFALTEGVDWLGRLDVGQQEELVQEVRAEILQSYGVITITSLDVVFDARKRNLLITFEIQTIYSQSLQSTTNLTTGS